MKSVAIIGMSFRFPGTTKENYWCDLLAGRDLVSMVDPTRWSVEAFGHPNQKNRGTSYSFAAGSLGDLSGFDAAFFGISPREAAQMDPQQRLMLELGWEAMENAGLKASSVRGSRCGVYIGISSGDYGMRMADDLSAVDSLMITGNTSSIAANRLSYFFDLRGPSMAIDTACSSSMVAFHQACQSILSGESSMAFAGGVSLHLHPLGFVAFSKSSMLSRKGWCSVFDASADGYVRSEGGGIFILKDYEQALADGDTVLAVVAATAVNTDGKKTGLTVPSRTAQIQLLTQIYAKAEINPDDIAYIEAHGTGTPVGDPIETSALGESIGQRRKSGNPLLIGSVKSNLGHLEAASGVAGLVKAIYCLNNRTVPKTIHIKTLNPNIRTDEWNLQIATENTALASAGRLTIGINSFGFGGANAHVILETSLKQAANSRVFAERNPQKLPLPILVSGSTEVALKTAAAKMSQFLRAGGESNLYEVAYTAAFKRDWHRFRGIVFGNNDDLIAKSLEEFSSGKVSACPVITAEGMSNPVAVVFVYSGNGSQWEGMGRRLLAEDPVFKIAVQKVDAIFGKFADFSLELELAGTNGIGRYANTEIAQPALFALQVGVTEMLRSRGVTPSMVVGHSVGEVAAAWACGSLSLEQAVCVIYHRSRLQGTTKGLGQMTAVALGCEAVRKLLGANGLNSRIGIAAINNARSVTIEGAPTALDVLESILQLNNVVFKRLDLDYAFHGSLMDPIKEKLLDALHQLSPSSQLLPFVSTVTGGELEGSALKAEYWWQNIRKPVLFAQAMASLRQIGGNLFVEIGPHPVLKTYIDSALKSDEGIEGRVIATVSRNDDRPSRVWDAASQVIISGGASDLAMFLPEPVGLAPLPNYPWQRERHWHSVTSGSRRLLQRQSVHPLLGYRLSEHEFCWENQIDAYLQPALADHIVDGALVFPGAAFAELGLAAATQWMANDNVASNLKLEDLEIHSPLVFCADTAKSLRVTLDSRDGQFSVVARDKFGTDAWVLHASGRVLKDPGMVKFEGLNLTKPLRTPDFAGEQHTQMAHFIGLRYGPAFCCVASGWIDGASVLAELVLPAKVQVEISDYLLHPALLDSAFQLVIHLIRNQLGEKGIAAFVPVRIESIILYSNSGIPCLARAELVRVTQHSGCANFSLFDATGKVAAVVSNVRFKRIPTRTDVKNHLQFFEYLAIPMGRNELSVEFRSSLLQSAKAVLMSTTAELSTDISLRSYAEQFEPLLDSLVVSFAVSILKSLTDGSRYLSDNWANEFVDQRRDTAQFTVWLIELLEDEGILIRSESGWEFNDSVEHFPPHVIWSLLISNFPGCWAVINAVGRIGLQLGELISGNVAPNQCQIGSMSERRVLLQILGQSGVTTLAGGFNQIIETALSMLPAGGRLRIAEFCGGSPVFADRALTDANRDKIDYIAVSGSPKFDDYSSSDSEGATRLPIRQVMFPPRGASIETGLNETCDLAIVAHDFTDRSCALQALQCAFSILKPGGALIFLSMPAARWLDFTCGIASDWWLEGGQSHGSKQIWDESYWEGYLGRLGFEGSESLQISAEVVHASALPYVIVAGKPKLATYVTETLPIKAQVWLVLTHGTPSEGSLAAHVLSQLSHANHKVVVLSQASRDDWSNVTEMAALLTGAAAQHGVITGLVDLQSLGNAECFDDLGDHNQIGPVQRCAIAASLVQACEILQLKLDCCFVTLGASSYLMPKLNPPNGLPDTRALQSSPDASLWAFVGTLRNEPSLLTARLIDIDGAVSTDIIGQAAALAVEIANPGDEREVLLTATGAGYVPRLRVKSIHLDGQAEPQQPENLRLVFTAPGQLRNLTWEIAALVPPLQGEVRIAVIATGLNFRDVMYALGALSDEAVEAGFAGPTLGLECSGVVTAVGTGVQGLVPGDRVVAFAASSFGRFVTTKAGAVAHIPKAMSFEAAATIPTTFFTAYYAIVHLARLQAGESILIHGAVGGVGLAAIQIARHSGAKIFATAGSDEKRDFLRLMGIQHIFDSRSLAFADEIMAVTEGRGVDVVLNSLAGEAITRNLGVLKAFGRFLELGKRDFYENTKIGLRPFRNNISYFGIDADQLLMQQSELANRLFREVMTLFTDGALHPIPYTTFEADQVISAFRHMQQAKQIGKVVVTYRDGINRVAKQHHEAPRLQLYGEVSYLVTGGLSGFGLKTALWLVKKGARYVVLVSRGGAASAEAQAGLAAMEAMGAKVMVVSCDISDQTQVKELFFNMASSMPPLRGVVHAAAIYEDSLVRNIDAAQLNRVFAPKVDGALLLHQHTLDMPLDFFVLYSSVTTLFGNPGQAAYVAANAGLESLARARRAINLPALCVKWGPIEDTGVLARSAELRDSLKSRIGGHFLKSEQALEILENLIVSGDAEACVADLNWGSISRFLPSAREPKFSDLLTDSDGGNSAMRQTDDISEMLVQLSEDELKVAFRKLLKAEISEILRIASDKIDDGRSIYDLGLDSLMGVELALAVESRFGVKLPIMVLSDSPTVAKLTDKIILQLKGSPADSDPSSNSQLQAKVTSTARQHGVEVEDEVIENFAENLNTSQGEPTQRMIH